MERSGDITIGSEDDRMADFLLEGDCNTVGRVGRGVLRLDVAFCLLNQFLTHSSSLPLQLNKGHDIRG